ncbi:hypothetical protein PVAP13_9NG282473 [Panicum virgatum]|uniref:Uncharacterized protein n=1 Tax=Panicum virgatum TaxID=38727 RepID=A0A8T0MBS2_PANVG|nr:hypothetical protein PVAP13_9NG282473 [Panicum virgatum]
MACRDLRRNTSESMRVHATTSFTVAPSNSLRARSPSASLAVTACPSSATVYRGARRSSLKWQVNVDPWRPPRRGTGVAALGFPPSNCWRAARRGRASSPVSQTAAALAAEAGHGGGAGERQHGVPTADQGRRAQGSWETQRREPLGSRIARAARGRLPATGWLAALAAEAGDGGGAGEEATALADLRSCGRGAPVTLNTQRPAGGAGHTHNGSCKSCSDVWSTSSRPMSEGA